MWTSLRRANKEGTSCPTESKSWGGGEAQTSYPRFHPHSCAYLAAAGVSCSSWVRHHVGSRF